MQISGIFSGEGFNKTSFENKIERTKFQIIFPKFDDAYKNQKDFYVLYSYDEFETQRKLFQIDPLLAFVEAVKLINSLITTIHFDFQNQADCTIHEKANEIIGRFNGKGFLINDDGISNEKYEFELLLLPTLNVEMHKYSCDLKIYNSKETLIDTKIYGIAPIEIFYTGCQFIASKLSYFEKY